MAYNPDEYIRPGAKAIIVYQGKILMVKENVERDGVKEVIYDFPGGGIDFGEGMLDALHREVFEELGLKIKVIDIVGTWSFMLDSFHRPGLKTHILCVGYHCEPVGTPIIDYSNNPAVEDIFDHVWLTKEEIFANDKEKGGEIFLNQEMRDALNKVKI